MPRIEPRRGLAGLLPTDVVVEQAVGDASAGGLFPEEEQAITGAVPNRRAEYAAVRECARRALTRLGHPPVPILSGPGREPLWPCGVVGSLTHCDGLRAAAVADAARIASLGIDAEPNAPLPRGVLQVVASGEEVRALARLARADPSIAWDRMLFSAKESVFKTWYPLMHAWLDFGECAVSIDRAGTFTATLLVPGPRVGGSTISGFVGLWAVENGCVLTAVCLTSDPDHG